MHQLATWGVLRARRLGVFHHHYHPFSLNHLRSARHLIQTGEINLPSRHITEKVWIFEKKNIFSQVKKYIYRSSPTTKSPLTAFQAGKKDKKTTGEEKELGIGEERVGLDGQQLK